MIAQQFDLFGHGDAPVATRKPARGTVNTGQGALFAPDAYDLVDTRRKPTEAPDLRADLHDLTIDDAPKVESPAAESAPIAVGDRYRDPNLLGSPCLVTDVDPAGTWFEARWIPGAPAYRYPTSHAARLVKVTDERPEVIDVAALTDDDVAALAAGATVVDDAYLAARTAALAENVDDAHPDVVRAAIGDTRYADAKRAALAAGAADVHAAITADLTPADRRLIRAAIDGTTPELDDLDAVYALIGADTWHAAAGTAVMPSTPDHTRAAVYRAALLAYINPITGQDITETLAAAADASPDVTGPGRPADPDALIATTRRVPSSHGHREFRYVGIVRRGRRVLAECGHEHTNRDDTTDRGGLSASACARDIIAGAALPATAEHVAARWRDRWQALTHTSGHTYSAVTIAATRAQSDTDARAYLDAVAAVRAATL